MSRFNPNLGTEELPRFPKGLCIVVLSFSGVFALVFFLLTYALTVERDEQRDRELHTQELGAVLSQRLLQIKNKMAITEEKAFAFSSVGQSQQGLALLVQEDYRHLKLEYAKQLRAMEALLNGERLSMERGSWRFYLGCMLLGLGLAFCLWLALLKNLLTHHTHMLENISLRKEAEDALNKRTQVLSLLIGSSPVAQALFDEKLNYLMASQKWRTYLGIEEECLEGHNFYELTPQENVHTDLHQLVLAGNSASNEGHFQVNRTGKPRWLRWEYHPWYNKNGLVGGMAMFIEDIALKKLAEEEAAKTKDKYRLLIDNLPDYIKEIDLNGELKFANRYMPNLFGLDQPKNVFQILAPVYHPVLEKTIKTAAETNSTQAMEMIHENKGVKIWYRLRVVPMRVLDDQTRLLLICSDITRQKLAEQARHRAQEELEQRVLERTAELENVNEEVKSFAYIISHDLRAPLVNIRGFVGEMRFAYEVLEPYITQQYEQLPEQERNRLSTAFDEDMPEAMNFIDTSVIRMDQLISSVLQLSRMGRKELHFQVVDTREIVSQCLANLAFRIENQRIETHLGELPKVVADFTALTQIFANLLANAVTYLQAGRIGMVSVGGERKSGFTRYWVKDNGRGIAAEDIPKVFELFRRVGSQLEEGEGMGMAYVKTLVARHGGKISCESKLGKGSKFIFTLSDQSPIHSGGA